MVDYSIFAGIQESLRIIHFAEVSSKIIYLMLTVG